MDGTEELINSIEEGRSEPSNDGGWVDPTPAAQPQQATPVVDSEWGTPLETDNTVTPQPAAVDPNVDKFGEVWNSDTHTAGRTQTKDGHWRRKRGKANAPTILSDPNGVNKEACEKAARQFVGQYVALTIGFAGGPESPAGKEWIPLKEPYDERAAMESAWTDYFIEHGIVKMPGWLAVSIAMGVYTFPRFMMPATQLRVKQIRELVKSKGKPKEAKNDSGNNPPNNGKSGSVDTGNAGSHSWGTRIDS